MFVTFFCKEFFSFLAVLGVFFSSPIRDQDFFHDIPMDVFSIFIHNEYAKYTGRGKQRGLAIHDSYVAWPKYSIRFL